MNHFSYDQWKKYAANEIEERVRESYDDHLYSCDQCLELYLQAVEVIEQKLPMMKDEDGFTNAVMAKLMENKVVVAKPTPFYQKKLFHYTVAAAMTILFMTSSLFQSITSYVEAGQSSVVHQEPAPSLTEELLNKTFTWIDSFELIKKGASN